MIMIENVWNDELRFGFLEWCNGIGNILGGIGKLI